MLRMAARKCFLRMDDVLAGTAEVPCGAGNFDGSRQKRRPHKIAAIMIEACDANR